MSGETSESFQDDDITTLLENVIEEENLHDYRIEDSAGAVKGDGYIGIITNVKVTGRDPLNEEKILHLVVKRASTSDAFRNELPVAAVFQREIYMYNTVFPKFRSLQLSKGMEPFSFVPRFYEGKNLDKRETVILENLKESGYRLYGRNSPMDDDHVSLAVTEYAQFHALSFALKDQRPEEYDFIIKNIDNLSAKIFFENFLSSVIHRCEKILQILKADSDAKTLEIFEKFSQKIPTYLRNLYEVTDEHSIILHGDCWSNNVMFKYDDEKTPNIPTKICLIDFQLSSIGPPVLDLACFFYSCSSNAIIDQLSYYMKLYHKSLSKYLEELGSDPKVVYPYTTLQKQWKSYARYGFLMALINIHATLTEESEAVDLKDLSTEDGGISDAFNYEISHAEEYNDRVKHIITHFITHDLF